MTSRTPPNRGVMPALALVFALLWTPPSHAAFDHSHAAWDALLRKDVVVAPGAFDDPRIHFAVVCASVGCPMLRNEAYTADRLESQLDDGERRFLSDRSRNRYDAGTGTLQVSRIFDWYRKDFEPGHKGVDSPGSVFARHADRLADGRDAQARIRAGDYRLQFLPYDWALNDVR